MAVEDIKPVRLKERQLFTPEAGLLRQVLATSKDLMLVRHLMEEGWVGARHSHPHEQMIYVVHGHLEFTGGDATFNLHTGDSFIVPGGVEHQARALEASEVLDIFHPHREDYASK